MAKQDKVGRITLRLNDKITLASLEFISFVLLPYHKYEQLFQRNEPTMHLLYDKQVELYKLVGFKNNEPLFNSFLDSTHSRQ